MLNTVYRLVSPKQLEAVIIDEELSSNTVIVRPTYLSICHADQRYYNGSRVSFKKKITDGTDS